MKEIQMHGGLKTIVSDCDYDAVAHLTWSRSISGKNIYAVNRRSAKTITLRRYLHRVILGAVKGQIVDHIDGNGLNNTRENLRFVTHCQNIRKMSKINNKNSSGYKGVYWKASDKVWVAVIGVDNKKIALGRFHCKHEAAIAYNTAAKKHFGEFASLNIISR